MEYYLKLVEIMEGMVESGVNRMDPVIRSIERKAWKVRWSLSQQEQDEIERIEYIKYLDDYILEAAY